MIKRMGSSTAFAAIALSVTAPVAAQDIATMKAPLEIQHIHNPAAELNTPEIRLQKMESRLRQLETENDALKTQLAQLEERARRFVMMPENCRGGTTGGISLGVSDRFHRNSFPYFTCGGGQ